MHHLPAHSLTTTTAGAGPDHDQAPGASSGPPMGAGAQTVGPYSAVFHAH